MIKRSSRRSNQGLEFVLYGARVRGESVTAIAADLPTSKPIWLGSYPLQITDNNKVRA